MKAVSFSLASGSIEISLRMILAVGTYILNESKDLQIAHYFALFLIN